MVVSLFYYGVLLNQLQPSKDDPDYLEGAKRVVTEKIFKYYQRADYNTTYQCVTVMGLRVKLIFWKEYHLINLILAKSLEVIKLI